MKILRLGVAAAVILCLLCLGLASEAAGALPEFKPAAGELLFLSLLYLQRSGPITVHCEHDKLRSGVAALIINAHLVGPLVIQYESCTSSGATKTGCPINSSGVESGLIDTTTLRGSLGLVLPSGRVGLLISPTSGKIWATLAANECAPETKVTGAEAGLVTPVGEPTLTGTVSFTPRDIEKIDTLSGLIEPELVAYSEPATVEGIEHYTWHNKVEVT